MSNRREFITLLGGAAAWPLTARAQQQAMPVVGYLDPRSADATADLVRGFRQGLKEAGYVEREDVAIEHRWAENQLDRLPALAADLTGRRVAVIAASSSAAAFAAKNATTTVPIVFVVPDDPVRLGLVASLARPGGNLTGINWFATEVTAKRLELLRDMVPATTRFALLVEPSNPTITEPTVRDVEAAARSMGLQMRILHADTRPEIDAAFATFAHDRPDALFVGPSAFFNARRVQLAQWAAHYRLPTTYSNRQNVEAGGLMSYGASLIDAHRQMGVYAGRVLKGARPADLPVMQATKLELVINLQTAMILGLEVPPSLLARADEVIE
jgi:putative ABC transport system substrate-binding protein